MPVDGIYHAAFAVRDLNPDGHKLEIHASDPTKRLDADRLNPSLCR